MALGWKGQYVRYREFYLNVMQVYKKNADLRAFLEVSLSLTTVTIFLVFALKPTALTIISLLQTIKEKQSTIASLDLKTRNLQTASGIFEQYQNVIPDVDIAVSTAADPDVITKQIQGIAAKNGVTIMGLSIGQITLIGKDTSPKKTQDYKPLPGNPKEMAISISVKGEYESLINFAKDFENLRVISKIDVFGINSSQTEQAQFIVAIISGRVPYLGQ